MPMHNTKTFTWWSNRPKVTSCGLNLDDFPKGKIDTLAQDARGDEARTKLVTCKECRAQMRRGWFLRWLFS